MEDYQTMLSKLKSGDKEVNFRDLRLAFTKTNAYAPYKKDPNSESMWKAHKEGNYAEAFKYAQQVLENNYVAVDAHIIAAIACGHLGKTKEEEYHRFIEIGLLQSIYDSGDGRGPDTAFVVISITEEYSLLNAMGIRSDRQELIELDGKHYDRLYGIHEPSGKEVVVLFNISIFYQPKYWT